MARAMPLRFPIAIMICMTTIDVLYRYGTHPTESAMAAIGRLSEVYGIRGIKFSQAERTVRVEYDATRLNEPDVNQLLRRAGLDVTQELAAIPPQPAAAVTPTAPTPVA